MTGDVQRLGPHLTIRYRPIREGGEIDAIAFVKYITESIAAVLQTAELLEDESVRATYLVTGLEKQSPAVVQLTPRVRLADVPRIRRAQDEHLVIVRELDAGRVPTGVDYGTLQTYRRLGDLAHKYAFKADVRVNGSTATVTQNLKHRLDLELQKDQSAAGTMTGYIRSYHSAGSRRLIRLYPRVGPSVACRFRREDQSRVRSLIDMYVRVEGEMRYRPNEHHPYFMTIEAIAPVSEGDGPTFEEMYGAFPEIEGNTESIVREARDGW